MNRDLRYNIKLDGDSFIKYRFAQKGNKLINLYAKSGEQCEEKPAGIIAEKRPELTPKKRKKKSDTKSRPYRLVCRKQWESRMSIPNIII